MRQFPGFAMRKRNTQTINTLKAAARGAVYIITVWAIEFDRINARKIGATARHHIASHTVDPRADAKCSTFILVDLKKSVRS